MREKYEIQPLLEKHNNWFNMYKKVLVLVNTFIILNSLKIKKVKMPRSSHFKSESGVRTNG